MCRRDASQIIEFAVGTSDVRTGTPATTDTIYQLGSMTKAAISGGLDGLARFLHTNCRVHPRVQ